MAEKSSTRKDVIHLTIANAIESGLRLLIPIFLVRIIDQAEFGEYRLFWLIANTLTLVVPLGMSRSLLYFLPRSEPEERAIYVSQTILYLSVVTFPIAAIFTLTPGWMPENIATLTEPAWVLGAFIYIWTVSSLILTLPNADRNIVWQKWAIIGLSVARAAIILSVAVVTRDLQQIFNALLAFAGLQTILLFYYVARNYGLKMRRLSRSGMMRQLHYAVPFGLSGMLARARGQIEQWIVAFMFLPGSLAILSVAAGFNGILRLLRKSVGSVLLPQMSSTHAAGDIKRSLELNNRGNIAIGFVVFPSVAFIWTFAPALIELLYTADYLDAVPLVRIYSVTMILMSVELATVLMIYEQGKFVAKVSGGILFAAAVLSYLGAVNFGLPGVAAGSVIGTFFNRLINYNRAANLLNIPFSRLQDWGSLARLLAAAALSGFAAHEIFSVFDVQFGPFFILLIGGASTGVFYLLLTVVFRVGWVMQCLLGRNPWPERTAI